MSHLEWVDIAASQIGNGDRVYYQGYWRTVRKVHDVDSAYLRLETHFHYFTLARSEIVSVVSAPRNGPVFKKQNGYTPHHVN